MILYTVPMPRKGKRAILTKQDVVRFNTYVSKSNTCWIWNGSRQSAGYGDFRTFSGQRLLAHRVAFIISGGQLSEDKPCVLHRCDTPECCNPDHLFAGSHLENTRDMINKGRSAVGDRNGSRKYPERLVRGSAHWSIAHPERVPRGMNNGAYTHPERRPWGDRNGSRLHPERVPRGDNHPSRLHPERMVRGEKHHNAKLTSEKAAQIRSIYSAGGTSLTSLGELFGVSKRTILNVVHGKIWKYA